MLIEPAYRSLKGTYGVLDLIRLYAVGETYGGSGYTILNIDPAEGAYADVFDGAIRVVEIVGIVPERVEPEIGRIVVRPRVVLVIGLDAGLSYIRG